MYNQMHGFTTNQAGGPLNLARGAVPLFSLVVWLNTAKLVCITQFIVLPDIGVRRLV